MTWFLLTNWAFGAAVLFVIMNSRRMPAREMIWTGLLCTIWPLLLLFFLIGSGLWFAGSVYHAVKRQQRHGNRKPKPAGVRHSRPKP